MPGCPSQVVNCTLSCESDCGGLTERSRTHCSPKHTSVATTSEGGDGGEQILGSGGKKKRKRTKGPSRRAKDELRRARFLVDKACRERGENGPGSRVTVTGPTALADADCRIVSCDAATTPECHCTVDCFADDTGHDPWFGWYPGYPMDEEAQPGTLRLASAPRPASERSHLGRTIIIMPPVGSLTWSRSPTRQRTRTPHQSAALPPLRKRSPNSWPERLPRLPIGLRLPGKSRCTHGRQPGAGGFPTASL
jgi:hypothetical protein